MFVGSGWTAYRKKHYIQFQCTVLHRNAGAFQNLAGGSTLTRGSNRIEDGGPSQGIYLAIEYMMTYGTQFDLHNAIPNNNPIPASRCCFKLCCWFWRIYWMDLRY